MTTSVPPTRPRVNASGGGNSPLRSWPQQMRMHRATPTGEAFDLGRQPDPRPRGAGAVMGVTDVAICGHNSSAASLHCFPFPGGIF
jgi:hypothetical protein